MSTVGQVVDRVYRDWLAPADDAPFMVPLAADVTATATTFSYTASGLTPEEEMGIAPGLLVDVGQEQVRIVTADHDANSFTVTRGVNGTTATTHTAGAELRIAPAYARRQVFDAVADNVVSLYPQLWHISTTTVTSASTYVEVPADVVSIVEARYLTGSRYLPVTIDFLPSFSPSATGKAIQFYGTPTGKTVYVTYRGRFDRPTAEATELSTLGVEPEWERIVAVGAAAQLIAGRELEPATLEFVTEALQTEGYPTGSSSRLRDSLLRYYGYLIDQASRNLQADMQIPVVRNVVDYVR